MAKLSRLIGLAAKAIESHVSSDRGGQDAPRSAARPSAPSAPQAYAPPAQGHTPPAPGGYTPPAPGYTPPAQAGYAPPAQGGTRGSSAVSDADRAAIARYDYLLQTADPHRIEQMHREAFDRLTPAQRAQVQERMQAELPSGERPSSASSHDLARAAGRTEATSPGRMRSLLSRVRGGGAGGGGGRVVGGRVVGGAAVGGAAVGILGAVAGGAVLSSVAGPLLEQAAGLGVDFDALAQGLDVESLMQGVDLEGLAGGVDVDGIGGAAEGLLGSAGETVSGLGETASGWGERLGDLGIPGIRDLFGR
ncbi:cation-transporting ATPase [Microbacterium foliorum]|uniref:cation-transporting ATPase n=1 Tax=Microbacterium foliorum TaxID=104336 RepID=UPI001DAA7367|nr:cation-transporting ATPase [Microbacterium foliorum]CAH0135949.1 hypothetical protein SRABI03_00397 [Microbacterium foliorum]CAH0162741.1 hypothetical protein SRABI44_01004 [Microbacterium foliorum]